MDDVKWFAFVNTVMNLWSS